jgi:hypothetical protein
MNFLIVLIVWMIYISPNGKKRGTVHLNSETKNNVKEEIITPENDKVIRISIDEAYFSRDPECILCPGEK